MRLLLWEIKDTTILNRLKSQRKGRRIRNNFRALAPVVKPIAQLPPSQGEENSLIAVTSNLEKSC